MRRRSKPTPVDDLNKLPKEALAKSGRAQATTGRQTPKDGTSLTFWGRIASESIGKVPPVEVAVEDEGRDGLKEALRNLKAKRLLEKLVKDDDKAKLKMASTEGVRRAQERRTYSAVPSLAHLRSLKSISKEEAADYLRCVPRTIRNYVKARNLTLTPKKRVAIDDKFVRMLQKVHGAGVLPPRFRPTVS